MSNEEIIQELDGLEVYLYRTKNVKDKAFVVEEGSLQLEGLRYLNMSKYHDTYMVFRSAEESGLKYIVRVSATEGKINNGYFWLRERDDDRAIDILIANAEERIEQYKRMIKNRENYIKQLCGMK